MLMIVFFGSGGRDEVDGAHCLLLEKLPWCTSVAWQGCTEVKFMIELFSAPEASDRQVAVPQFHGPKLVPPAQPQRPRSSTSGLLLVHKLLTHLSAARRLMHVRLVLWNCQKGKVDLAQLLEKWARSNDFVPYI